MAGALLSLHDIGNGVSRYATNSFLVHFISNKNALLCGHQMPRMGCMAFTSAFPKIVTDHATFRCAKLVHLLKSSWHCYENLDVQKTFPFLCYRIELGWAMVLQITNKTCLQHSCIMHFKILMQDDYDDTLVQCLHVSRQQTIPRVITFLALWDVP